MEQNRLDILAERFWEGACSEAEEQELKKLVSGAVPERHAELKVYLNFTLDEQGEDVLGGAFDAQIMQEIDRRSSAQSGSPTWMKIAAGIAILLGLYGGLQMMKDSPIEAPEAEVLALAEDTFEDPEMAYEEVKKALALMGMKMNAGMDHAGSIGMFDQATEAINKAPAKSKP